MDADSALRDGSARLDYKALNALPESLERALSGLGVGKPPCPLPGPPPRSLEPAWKPTYPGEDPPF